MMNTFTVELAYGENKKLVLNGKYLKGLARAVEGGQPSADAELLLLTDDSEEKAEVWLNYSENKSILLTVALSSVKSKLTLFSPFII